MSLYTELAEIPSPTAAHFLSPSPASAGDQPNAGNGESLIQLTYSVRDHSKNVKRTMSKTVFVGPQAPAIAGFSRIGTGGGTAAGAGVVSGPLLDTDVIAQVVSPSGAKRAVWRNVKGEKDSKDKVVEVWEGDALVRRWLVGDVHGDVYADEYLSSFAFSPSESYLVYVAEQKAPEGDKNNKSKDPFTKFRYTPDFGEGLTGKRRPGIFLLNLRIADPELEHESQSQPGFESAWEGPVLVRPPKDSAAEGVHFGQPIFSATKDDVLYATGYELTLDGRILGPKGCFNRPTGIWQLRLDLNGSGEGKKTVKDEDEKKTVKEIPAQCLKLTPSHLSCRSPRILLVNDPHSQTQTRGKSTLFWLACRSGGAHLATSTIHALTIDNDNELELSESTSAKKREVVSIVDVPRAEVQNGFPGLYPDYNFAAVPFVLASSSKASIIIASTWGSRKTILRVDIASGAVTDLTPPGTAPTSNGDEEVYSWNLLGTDGQRRVLCTRSSPAVPYEVLLGDLQENGEVLWRVVDRPSLKKSVADALKAVKTSILPIPGRDKLVETILIQSSNVDRGSSASKPPCITSPHGGPHGTSMTTFTPLNTALVLDGYTLSLPNYTGSPAFGETFLQGLIGKCGDLDVEDTMESARYLIKQGISEEGPGKQFVMGGSHGGWVTAHLIGRYPDFFSAAILRNPVISAGDISNTDIPDWYFSEFGEGYPIYSSIPSIAFDSDTKDQESVSSLVPPLMSASVYAQLQAISPIAAVDKIRVPVLLLIGASDRRVAPAQGMAFYHALKARYSVLAQGGDSKTPASAAAKVEMLVFDGEGHPIDGVEASKACAEASTQWLAQAGAGST